MLTRVLVFDLGCQDLVIMNDMLHNNLRHAENDMTNIDYATLSQLVFNGVFRGSKRITRY